MGKQELTECPICGQTYEKNDYEYCQNCEDENLDKKIETARLSCKKDKENLDRLMAKKNEYPRLIEKTKLFVGYRYSDSYIQSMLYASRTPNIGINDIVKIIAEARNCNASPLKIV